MPFFRTTTIAFFAALLTSALVLGPALAHVLELPNKIGLPREEYFIVQKAYRGWNQIAWLLGVQVLALVGAAILARAERRVMMLTVSPWPVSWQPKACSGRSPTLPMS